MISKGNFEIDKLKHNEGFCRSLGLCLISEEAVIGDVPCSFRVLHCSIYKRVGKLHRMNAPAYFYQPELVFVSVFFLICIMIPSLSALVVKIVTGQEDSSRG